MFGYEVAQVPVFTSNNVYPVAPKKLLIKLTSPPLVRFVAIIALQCWS